MNKGNCNKDELNKILNSKLFKGRELHRKLLEYLVNASFEGTTPKEVTIAYDIFNKGKDFNSAEDTTVRVHMHNLRNKLEQYYQTEGQSDDIQLFIPKGHYQVKFIKKSRPESHWKRNFKNVYVVFLAALLCCALLYLLVDKFYFHKHSQYFKGIDNNNVFWKDFFDNGYPTSIIIGDFFVFHEHSLQLNRTRRIQDYEINTKEELDVYAEENKDNNVEKWFLGELPHNSIFNITDIQRILLSFKQKLNINFTTEIDIDFIKNRNIIYVGEFKNLRALSDLTSVLPLKYETLAWWHGTISYESQDSLTILKTFHDWDISRYVVDLAMVAKLPGQNNENYIIFAGFGYNSQIKVVKLFSDNSSMKKIQEEIETMNGSVPEYFVTVFEVTGFDRASATAQLKYYREIKKDSYRQKFYPKND